MGTMTDGVTAHQASSAAILIMSASRSEYAGRETLRCAACGRAQFNKGQQACIACRASLLICLEPLDDSDAMPRTTKPARSANFEPGQACARLRDLRKVLGISQGMLCNRARCPRPHVSKYENGVIIPTIAFLDRITQSLGITMAELMDTRLTVEQLAVCSLLRSPGDGELMGAVIRLLPKLNQNSRALILQVASGLCK